MKTLLVVDEFVEQLTRCLRFGDRESPLELVPELQEPTYYRRPSRDAFTSFIDARLNAGCPVSFVRHSTSPIPGPSRDSLCSRDHISEQLSRG